MKRKLQRILSVLCALLLAAGCVSAAALAEEAAEPRFITAVWADEDNYDALRPDSIQVTLGDQPPVTLNEANRWTAEAAAPAGTEWTVPTVEGYVVNSRGTDVTVVTFTHAVRKTSAAATVVWNDNGNAGGIRPDSVQVRLLADGEPCGAALAASPRNGWTVSWENLPVTRKGETAEIAYSIEEIAPEGYQVSVSGLTVTNTLLTGGLTLQASVTGAPEGSDVSGLKLTVTGPDPRMPVTLTYGQLAGGTYDFGQVLPGTYLLQESNADSLVEGYEMDPAASRVGDAVMVRAGETAGLSFRYAYRVPAEAEPNEDPLASAGNLTIEILGPDPRMPMTVTYAQFTGGKYELDGLVPGEYCVIERNAENLVSAYTLKSDSVTGMSITVGEGGATASLFNHYAPAAVPLPEAELLDIPVTKTWNDDNNRDGNRPASVTVILYADGVAADSRTITEADGWTCTFTGLDRWYEDGTEIRYSVGEEPVEWYTPTVNGFHITNNYQPETTAVTVSKVWDDNNNAQKIRPTTLAVTLEPLGKVYILSEENGWTVTADNLPVRINGQPAEYSWKEQETLGYVAEGKSVSGSVTVFTNRISEIPQVPDEYRKPRTPGGSWAMFEDYQTALGVELIINHVGDCFD